MTQATRQAREKVLVIDDNLLSRMVVSGILSDTYTVVEAEDGERGLVQAATEAPDLILLDLVMPGMDGIEVCRRLKANPDGPYLPILVLTGAGDQERRNEALEAGADDFLVKPVDPKELTLRVAAFLRLRRQDIVIRKQVDELRKMDSLKEDLVTLVTHDLRNALTGILVYLELARGSMGGSPELDQVTAAAQSMQATLEDMLRVQQIEDGVLHVLPEPTTAAALVDSAIRTVMPYAQTRGVTLRVRGQVQAPLRVDVSLVQRSVFNLLQNAVKFGPKHADVLVEVQQLPGAVRIRIVDKGPGVATESRRTVFEKYGRLEARRGFGLGLYLVQQVTQAHGGSAWVEDGLEGGSVFVVELPAPA